MQAVVPVEALAGVHVRDEAAGDACDAARVFELAARVDTLDAGLASGGRERERAGGERYRAREERAKRGMERHEASRYHERRVVCERLSTTVVPVMVLGAGFGTRLLPLTAEVPKPLLSLGDGTVLGELARALAARGVERVVINTHHRASAFDEAIRSLCVEARLSPEARILGTAGGVANAAPLLGGGPVIVWNGDILCEPPLASLVAAAGEGIALLVAPTTGVGTVGLAADGSGRVVRLRGERHGAEGAAGDYVGVLALGEAARARLPPEGCLIGDLCLPWLREGRPLASVALSGPWRDLGTPQSYAAANRDWLAARGLACWVHPSARIGEGLVLSGSVVGAGACVDGPRGAEVTDAVVWPGATLRAPARRVVATRRLRLFLPATPP